MDERLYINCIPADGVAANTLRGGFEYVTEKNITNHHADSCTNVEIPNGQKKEIEALIGIRFGRLTVVGYGGKASSRAIYNVKCDCGKYETRRYRAIKNTNNKSDCCQECRQLAYIKKSEYFRRTGRDLD